jgi:hypothetical protein
MPVDLVRHIVEEEPDATSFQRIRDGLVAAHILTDYQCIDRLVGRKPSEMLAEMNKLKPANNEQFISGWVGHFGVPVLLTSDRGVQFTSALWGAVMKRLGIKHNMSTAFHPQSNSLMERAHRRLKDALKARLAGSQWSSHLPWVLLGLLVAPREDSGVSAAELVYGAPLTLPGLLLTAAEPPPEFFLQQLQSLVPCMATRPYPDKTDPADLEALMTATHVYVRSPPAAPSLTPAYRGPFLVHKRAGKYFILRMGSRFDTITVDRLKPHRGSSPPDVTLPPRRGHPSNVK